MEIKREYVDVFKLELTSISVSSESHLFHRLKYTCKEEIVRKRGKSVSCQPSLYFQMIENNFCKGIFINSF